MATKDFFLEPDDAQTLGDVKYMRKSVKVRRTFPKTLKNPEGFAVEKEVSATVDEKVSPNRNGVAQPATSFTAPVSVSAPQPTAASNPEPRSVAAPTSASTSTAFVAKKSSAGSQPKERQKGDSSLNMFRDMAKNINTRGKS